MTDEQRKQVEEMFEGCKAQAVELAHHWNHMIEMNQRVGISIPTSTVAVACSLLLDCCTHLNGMDAEIVEALRQLTIKRAGEFYKPGMRNEA